MRARSCSTLDPPRHTQLRKLVNKGFTPRQINALEPRIRERVVAILDAAAERGTFDLVTDVAVEVPLQVIAELVGVPEDERHKVFAWTERMMSLDDPEMGGTLEDARAAIAEMFAYADTLAADRVARRRHRPAQRPPARGGRRRRGCPRWTSTCSSCS